MRAFFHSYPVGADVEECWRALAVRKVEEIDDAILELQEARGLLEEALRRGCKSVEECASLLSDVSRARHQ
jgi:hypothetical protein